MPEYRANHPSEMEPAHPGEILREDVLPALNLTVSESARQLLVSRQSRQRSISGQKRGI